MEKISTSPKKIEETLNQIWERLEKSNAMRASLFNLVIYAPKDKRSDYLHTVARRVIEKFPSRIILISHNHQSKKELQVIVSAFSSSNEESTGTHCDLIEIEVGDDESVKVPFMILPHILTDLPTYLVWGEDPSLENPLFPPLSSLAKRVIFDSESSKDLSTFAKTLLKLHESPYDIADLNWARTESWRHLLSSTFHSSARLKELQKTEKITITFNPKQTDSFSKAEIPALYLQGWIASQMHWILDEKNSQFPHFIYHKGNRKIEVTLVAKEQKKLPGASISSLEISSSDGYHFSFNQSDRYPRQINVHISSKEVCELPSQYILPKAESGQSLANEICHKGTSAHYLTLLKLLKGLPL